MYGMFCIKFSQSRMKGESWSGAKHLVFVIVFVSPHCFTSTPSSLKLLGQIGGKLTCNPHQSW
jgi:hypothetical protein